MRIAFFDSGLGGVTVMAEAQKQMPCEQYIYYADSLHVPYGEKPKQEVRDYIFAAVDFLAQSGIKALVVACNTATSIAVKDLRQRYLFPVIGMEPSVKPAVRSAGIGKRVLVLATSLTLKEAKFRELVSAVDTEHIVDSMAMPELVEFAETLTFDEAIVVPCLRKKFAALNLDNYGTVVLGCTHFPFFANSLRQVLPPGTDIIDGAAGTVRNLMHKLSEAGLMSEAGAGDILFCSSGGCQDETKLREAFAVARAMI